MAVTNNQRFYQNNRRPPSDHASDGNGNAHKTFSANTQLYTQDGRALHAFQILEGTVQLVRSTGLKRVVVQEAGAGSILGASDVLKGGCFQFSAIAKNTVKAQIIRKGQLKAESAKLSPTMQQILTSQCEMVARLSKLAEAPSVEQTFIGICRGLELFLPPGHSPMPESQLTSKIRNLFGLPSPIVGQVLRVLSDLHLIKRQQKGPMEADIELVGDHLAKRAAVLVDRWLPTLPSLLTQDLPREPYSAEELAAEVGVDEKAILRRILSPDFPTRILLFDSEGIEGIRKVYGDAFFKKRMSSKDLIADAQSVEDLLEVDNTLLRGFIPQMDISRLCQLLTRTSPPVSEHLLKALSGRMRRVALAEVAAMSPISDSLFADLEQDLMEMAQASLSGGKR